MNRINRIFLILASAAAFSAQATELAETVAAPAVTVDQQTVFTSTKPQSKGVRSFAEFSTRQTPCRVIASGWRAPDIPELRKVFTAAGMNVTTDEKAECQIQVSGSVTMQNMDGSAVASVNAEFLLANRHKVPNVPAAISETDLLEAAKKVSEGASATDYELAARAGLAASGTGGGIAGVVAVGAISVISSVVSAKTAAPGVATIDAMITAKGGFLPPALGLKVYAASTQEEMPATLIRAAVKRFVDEIEQKELADKKEAGLLPAEVQPGAEKEQEE